MRRHRGSAGLRVWKRCRRASASHRRADGDCRGQGRTETDRRWSSSTSKRRATTRAAVWARVQQQRLADRHPRRCQRPTHSASQRTRCRRCFRPNDQTGYLVFADPDGCLELPPPFDSAGTPCSGFPSDETYMEFTNDVDQAGCHDNGGNPGRVARAGRCRPTAATGVPRGRRPQRRFRARRRRRRRSGRPPARASTMASATARTTTFPAWCCCRRSVTGLVLDADFNRPARTRSNATSPASCNGSATNFRRRRDNTVVHAG